MAEDFVGITLDVQKIHLVRNSYAEVILVDILVEDKNLV